MSTKCSSGAVPYPLCPFGTSPLDKGSRPRGRFAFFFAMEKEGRRPQAAKYPAHNERNPNSAPSSGPFGATYPYPLWPSAISP